MLGLLLSGIAPGIALLLYFYLKDQYEPEPILMVTQTFFLGAILLFPVAFIEYTFQTEGVFKSEIANAFISNGMLEELFKWFILFGIMYRHPEFDDPFDGIVYGTAVSLGFATAENILYLVSYGLDFAFNRALLPVSSHAMFGVIMGYYVSKSKFTTNLKWTWLLLSIFMPAMFHGTYNYILLVQKSWFTFIIPFMILLWWFGMRKVRRAKFSSKKHFEEGYYIQ